MQRRWIVRDSGLAPALWVVGLAMMLITVLATVIVVVVMGRRHRRALDEDGIGHPDTVPLGGEVAEA